MRNIIVVVLFGLLILAPAAVLAQDLESEPQEIDDSENLDIVVSYDTQSPSSKKFKLVADITSGIDSDRVVVEWMLPNGIKFAEDNESRYSRPSVRAGEITQVQKLVEPRYAGTYEVEVVATAIKAEVNYLSSDKIELTFNDKNEIIPLSDEYKDAKMLHQLTQIGTYTVVGLLALGGIYFLYRQIRSIRD